MLRPLTPVKPLKYFTLVFLIFLNGTLSAQIIGADIDVIKKDSGRFEAILHLKCFADSVTLPTPQIKCKAQNNTYTADSISMIKSYTLDSINIKSCLPYDSLEYYPGIPRIIALDYRGVFDLSGDSTCDLRFFIREQTNNSLLTTAMRDWIYIETQFNRCVDSFFASPVCAAELPTYIAAQQDLFHNNGVIDNSQSDSIFYNFYQCRTDQNQTINYISPFHAMWWVTFFGSPNYNLPWPAGIHLNPETGELSFRPTQYNQGAIYTIEVKVYRLFNGVMTLVCTKYTERFLRTQTIQTNNLPKISTPFSTVACVNQETCMEVNVSDDDPSDSLHVKINTDNLPGARIDTLSTGKYPSFKVCWIPDSSYARSIPYTMLVTVEDDFCPFSSRNARVFNWYVRAAPPTNYTITKDTQCNSIQYSLPRFGGISSWSFVDSSSSDTSKYNAFDGIADLSSGKYYMHLVAQDTFGCIQVMEDSFSLNLTDRPRYSSSPKIQNICEGDSAELAITDAQSNYSYWWTDNTTDTLRKFSIERDSLRFMLLVNNSGCLKIDSFYINALQRTPFTYSITSDALCNQAIFDFSSTDSSVFGNMSWKIRDSLSGFDTTVLPGNDLQVIPEGTWYSLLEVNSIQGCLQQKFDTFKIGNFPYPKYVSHDHFAKGCEGEMDTIGILSTTPGYTYSWSDGLKDSARIISIGFDTLHYTLEVRNGTCMSRDSFWVYPNKKPSLSKSAAWIGKDSLMLNILSPVPTASYYWFLDYADEAIDSGTMVILEVNERHYHIIKLKTTNYMCTDSIQFRVESNLNTGLYTMKDISVYPNPFSDRIHLPKLDYTSIHLYTFAGQEIEIHLENTQNEIVVIPNTELSSGAYLLRLEDGQTSYRIRLIHH